MKTWTLPAVIAALALFLADCQKKEAAQPGAAEPAKSEVAKPAAQNSASTASASPASASTASGSDDNCGAVYDFTKKLSEAFAEKLKKAGGKHNLPPRDKFIAACRSLPPEVSRCLNPQVGMKESAKCQQVINAHRDKMIKFKQMLDGQ